MLMWERKRIHNKSHFYIHWGPLRQLWEEQNVSFAAIFEVADPELCW